MVELEALGPSLETLGNTIASTIGHVSSANLAVMEVLLAVLVEKKVLDKTDIIKILDTLQTMADEKEADSSHIAAAAAHMKAFFGA